MVKIAKTKIPKARRAELRRLAHARVADCGLAAIDGADLAGEDLVAFRVEVGRIIDHLKKRARLDALMSSAKQTWRTPESFLALVRAVAPIGLDPFGPGVAGARLDIDPARDVLLANGTTRKESALRIDWFTWRVDVFDGEIQPVQPGELIFCNPEYGRKLDRFMSAICAVGQAARERGIGVLALVPSRTDAAWSRDFALPPASDAVAFMSQRIPFVGAEHGAPFPSAVPFWGPPAMVNRFVEVFTPHAEVWRVGIPDEEIPEGKPPASWLDCPECRARSKAGAEPPRCDAHRMPPARHDWPGREEHGS